ncbi:hypothetical protein RhiJN_27003 [Ceratobasidium sp. AG-Ba]|nr:hypothetical protein RhiJN_27003 [Ceratobasidium sp. AG-Ba]
MSSALQERAVINRMRKSKVTQRKSNIKHKLAMVELMDNATYETLPRIKVKDLDNQIDRLRESGDSPVRAKAAIRSKEAKIDEIVAGFERRKQKIMTQNGLFKAKKPIPLEYINAEDAEECPKDVELGFNGGVLL